MSGGKLIANNKKAYHEYFIDETFEAGIVLTGTEVKSIRMGKVSIKESYAEIKNGEMFIVSMNISPYEMGNINNVDSLRRRKLLLHKSEITKMQGFITLKGLTIIPVKVYINSRGLVKVLLGVAKGKQLHDKRQSLAKKDSERRMQRELKDNY